MLTQTFISALHILCSYSILLKTNPFQVTRLRLIELTEKKKFLFSYVYPFYE